MYQQRNDVAMTLTKPLEATSGRRELGAMLSLLRRERNYTANGVAQALDWSPSRISRIEHGLTGISDSHLATLLALYQVGEDVFVRLFDVNRIALEHSRVRPHHEPLSGGLCVASLYEAAATRVTEYAPLAVPDLLQTPDYARALMRTAELVTDDVADLRLRTLKQRQEILGRAYPTLRFFLSEHVLRTSLGDKQTMARQLRRLTGIVERREGTIRVLPTSADAAAFGCRFRILEYSDSRDIAHTQTPTAHVFHENPADVDTYREIFARLRAFALDEERSVQVINHLAITAEQHD